MTRLFAPLAVLAVAGALFLLGNHVLFSDGGGYVVRAEMRDASGLVKESAVKVGGVPAGRVTSIALTKRDTALVTMRLDKGAAPLRDGATARIRPVNLLGEKYVELHQAKGPAMPSGRARIPLAHSSSAVELDDVFNTLDADTRTRLAVLINESGVAMNHRGADFNAMLRALPPALDDARTLVAGLGADQQALGRAIARGDRVLSAMNGRRGDLQRLVVNAADTLRATAGRRARIGETLRNAPGALSQLRSTLDELSSAATALRPAGRALRQAAPQLNGALAELPAFTQDAGPALAALRHDAPALRRLSAGAAPTVAALQPAAADLESVARQSGPVVQSLDRGDVMRDLLRVMWGWARTIQGSDGLGHVFGLRLNVDSTVITSALQRLLPKPAAKDERRKPAAAPAARPAPRLPQADALPKVLKPVGGVLDKVKATVTDTTQKTTANVSKLLDFLLQP